MLLSPGSTGRTASVDLDVTAHTVRDVRAVVLDLAAAWDSAVSPADLALLTDEMTADVVDSLVTGTHLLLEIGLEGDALRVALTDPAPGRPPGSPVIGLVRVLADRQGDETTRAGRRRWFELEPPTTDEEAAGTGFRRSPGVEAELRRSLELAAVAAQLARAATPRAPAPAATGTRTAPRPSWTRAAGAVFGVFSAVAAGARPRRPRTRA